MSTAPVPRGLDGKLWDVLRRHWLAALFGFLIAVSVIAYAPVVRMGYTTDDFIEIGARHFDALDTFPNEDWGLWLARFAERSFIDPVTGWGIFRPERQLLFWSDYLMWHLDPLGYHITNVILQVLTSFVVALIAWRMTRRRWVALLAGFLFAVLSIHAGPVAGISSRGHVMAGLFSAMTVLCYLLPRRPLTVGLGVLSFVLALGSKETALVVPALLLLYEGVSGQLRRGRIRASIQRQLPFWIVLVLYLGARLVAVGQVANSPYTLGTWNWIYQVVGYTQYAFDPFFPDIGDMQAWYLLTGYGLVLLLYHSRPLVVFGMLWVPIALLPTLTFPPQDRYFYTASIGLALALAGILADPIPALGRRWSRALGAVLVLGLAFAYISASLTLIGEYVSASNSAARFVRQVRALHPTFPPNSKIFFVGVPQRARRGYVLGDSLQVQYALQLAYGDRSLEVTSDNRFPFVSQDLDRTFFLEYEDGQLADRPDLIQGLETRVQCPAAPPREIVWNFRSDPQGWEPWNEVEGFEASKGALRFHTTGDDPSIGSPVLEVKPRQLDHIEVELRARSPQAVLNGELYWQTAAMNDFSPGARAPFQLPADGELHTFTFAPALEGRDPLVRLRLDPADAPADIVIRTVRLVCR